MSYRARVLLLTLNALLLLTVIGALEVDGWDLLDSDDFTGAEASAPDTDRWIVKAKDANDYVRIESDTLGCKVTGGGWAQVETRTNITTNNLTLLVDWRPITLTGLSLDLRLLSWTGATHEQYLDFSYESVSLGWSIWYRTAGSYTEWHSYVTNLVADRWYTVNVTYRTDTLNVSVKDIVSGDTLFTKSDWSMQPLNGNQILRLGSYGATAQQNPLCYYDNYNLYDLDWHYHAPPVWGPLPPLSATEDVPFLYDFGMNATDLDTPRNRLEISTTSPFVVAIFRFNVTFLFPNGITSAQVPLTLGDGFTHSPALINFTVTPVNDPPLCTVPTEHAATEDVPLTINFTAFVRDVDDPIAGLSLVLDDPYATVESLNLTVTFPEGVLSHDLYLNVSDGHNGTGVHLHFSVAPVDDPPVISPLPQQSASEDRESTFDLAPFLSDIDTPLPLLRALVRDANCTVQGLTLHFLFARGDLDLAIEVEVADAHSRVTAMLQVHVVEVNDPPVVHAVSPKLFVEDEAKTVDLSPYIEDEDTARDSLVLECADPHLVDVTGLNLTLLYPRWMAGHRVNFTAFDRIARTNGSFEVQVEEVNDPPHLLGIDGREPPISLSIDEGAELWLRIDVYDEDGTDPGFSVTSTWPGITVFQNASLRVSADPGDIGNYTATLLVDDQNGGTDSATLSISVRNVNDPPTVPIIGKPLNHTIVEEGTNVTFSVSFEDPDILLGQVLTVTWVSNISGLFMSRTTEDSMEFVLSSLPVGAHSINVTVTDGQYVRSASIEMTVTARYVPPPPPPEEPSFFTKPAGIATILIVIVLVLIVVLLSVSWTRRRLAEREAAEEDRARAEVERQRQVEASVEIKMDGDLARLHRSIGDMATELEAQRAAEASVAAPPAPAPVLEPVVTVTTAEEEADRERTREMREVMRSLTQLPQGLPTSLAGWDMAELARTIVDGERRTAADGTPLVLIKGKWYCADRGNVGTFVREWKEPAPVPGGPLTDADRARRLEQLEIALLEGKISEGTYKELKGKFEGDG